MQLPIPYDALVGTIVRNLAGFLVERSAHSGFRNIQSINNPREYWMSHIIPHRDEGTLRPPQGSKDVYPAILYSFLTLFAPNGIGWDIPKIISERTVPKATSVTSGNCIRVVPHGMLLVSDTSLQDAWPLDLVENTATARTARIRTFIDEHRCLLSAPIFFEPAPFSIWRSDFYARRRLSGTIRMVWSGMARTEREANMLGGLLVEYFSSYAKEDLLWGCLWGNENDATYEIFPSAVGALSPGEIIAAQQEIIERRDLSVTFTVAAIVERKVDPIVAVMLGITDDFATENLRVGPEWLLPT